MSEAFVVIKPDALYTRDKTISGVIEVVEDPMATMVVHGNQRDLIDDGESVRSQRIRSSDEAGVTSVERRDAGR